MILGPLRSPLRHLRRDSALLLSGFPLALLAVLVLLPLLAVAAALAAIWAGVLLLPVVLMLAASFAQRDRRRLRRWGLALADPEYRSRSQGLLRLLGDGRRWLDLAFEAVLALPLRAVTTVTALAWLLCALGALTYWAWGDALRPAGPDIPGGWALALVVGMTMLIALPVVVHVLARLEILVSAPLLGGDAVMPVRPPLEQEPAAQREGVLRRSAWTRMALAFVGLVLVIVGWPVLSSAYGVNVSLAMVATIVHGAAPLLAVRWPWAGLSATAVASLATILLSAGGLGIAPWPWPVTTLLAHCLTLAVLAVFHRWYWGLSTWSAGVVLTLGAMALTDPATLDPARRGSLLTNGVVLIAISGGVVLLGLTVHQWLLASSQVERAQSVSAEQVRRRQELEERNRIARELHDVVAHSMSVITVQAGTAAFRMPGLDEEVRREFEEIAGSSRQALGEMRTLLATLRSDDGLDTVPMPGIEDLEDLISSTRGAGARITAELEAPTLPPTVSLTAYRVVQEGLSNALRHAGAAPITVRLRMLEDRATLAVEVENASPEEPTASIPGSGLGLTGTRERVTALGGRVDAGPTAQGGFAVRARIPVADPLPR